MLLSMSSYRSDDTIAQLSSGIIIVEMRNEYLNNN